MKSLLKVNLILGLIRFVIGVIAVGIGIWYLSSSIGGASLFKDAKNIVVNVGKNIKENLSTLSSSGGTTP